MRRSLWLCVLVMLFPVKAAAQETRGRISGTVRDEQGVVPGARVRLTNEVPGVGQRLVSKGSG